MKRRHERGWYQWKPFWFKCMNRIDAGQCRISWYIRRAIRVQLNDPHYIYTAQSLARATINWVFSNRTCPQVVNSLAHQAHTCGIHQKSLLLFDARQRHSPQNWNVIERIDHIYCFFDDVCAIRRGWRGMAKHVCWNIKKRKHCEWNTQKIGNDIIRFRIGWTIELYTGFVYFIAPINSECCRGQSCELVIDSLTNSK